MFESLSQLFRSKEESAASDEFSTISGQLDSAISTLQDRMQAKRQEQEAQQQSNFRTSANSNQSAIQNAKQAREQRLKIAKQQIREDIIKLVAELEIALTNEAYDELVEFAQTTVQQMSKQNSGTLQERTRAAVLIRLFEESGPLAWEFLNNKMSKVGISWSDPDALHPGVTEEELRAARKRRIREIEDLFLTIRPVSMATLIVGQVPAWKSDYPDQGSASWRELALQAVGMAARTSLVKHAVDQLTGDISQIRSEAEQLLKYELTLVNQALDAGMDSIEEADKVVSSASTLLNEVIPDMCWQRVKPHIMELAEKAR